MTYPAHNIGNPMLYFNTSQPQPNAAHARGTTQLRVSLLAVWLTRFAETHKDDAKLMALYGLIAPALAACMESCGAGSKQKQSAAVLRRADMEITWVERVRIDELGPQPETPDAWASWWIALDAIATDGMATWDQGRHYCWTRLCDDVELLAEELLGRARNPGKAEVTGVRLYERAMEASTWV